VTDGVPERDCSMARASDQSGGSVRDGGARGGCRLTGRKGNMSIAMVVVPPGGGRFQAGDQKNCFKALSQAPQSRPELCPVFLSRSGAWTIGRSSFWLFLNPQKSFLRCFSVVSPHPGTNKKCLWRGVFYGRYQFFTCIFFLVFGLGFLLFLFFCFTVERSNKAVGAYAAR